MFPIPGRLIILAFSVGLASCARVSRKDSTIDSAKAIVSAPEKFDKHSGKQDWRTTASLSPIPPATLLWPDSWKEYHERYNNYLIARKQFWPHPEIRFEKPFRMEWDLIVSKDRGSFMSQRKDGVQFFRYGRHYLTRSSDNLDHSLQTFNSGFYVASVWRPTKEYQHMSPPFYFTVRTEKNESTGKTTRRIEPYSPKSDDEFFPNQWWYYNEDFFRWDTHRIPPLKNGKKPDSTSPTPPLGFFSNLRPFEPDIALEEAEDSNGPIVKRNLLSPKLEKLLELRLYYEGKLMKTESATGRESWTFDHGPGHYVFLIVAPDGDGGALIVARPFQAWFPDEGDGILRLVPLDTDKDGMPDYWEKWYDLDPKDSGDGDRIYSKTTYLKYYKLEKFYNRVR